MSVVASPDDCEGPGPSRRSDGDERMWVEMRRKVELVGVDVLINGERALLDVAPPPTASLLAVNRAVIAGPSRIRSSGTIHCCDDASGLVLFAVTGGGASATATEYFVYNAGESSVVLLPGVPDSLPRRSCSNERMGLIADPARGGGRGGGGGGGGGGCGDFLAAQLHAKEEQQPPRLLTFRSSTKRWSLNDIPVPPLVCGQISRMQPEFVISHGERLVFVDLQRGLLLVNPFTQGVTARFVAFPPLPSGRAEPDSDSDSDDPHTLSDAIARSRCVTLCNGRLHHFRLDGLPEPPVISAWRLLDAEEGIGRQDWFPVYSVSLDIWPLLIMHRDAVGIGLADPRCASVVYLFADEKLIGVDVHKGEIIHCGVFLPEVSRIGYASTDVCAWTPPPRTAQCSIALKYGKKFAKKVRKSFKKVASYVKQNPDSLITAGTAVDSLAAYIPVSMKKTRAGASYLGRALSGAGTAIKANNAGAEWLHEISEIKEFTGSFDVVTVRTPAEAKEVIIGWEGSGKPNDMFRVQFPEELNDQEKNGISAIFVAHGAEELLHLNCDWHLI